MLSDHPNKIMLWLLLISNTALCMVVLVKLRTSPSEILARLEKAEFNAKLAIDDLKTKQEFLSKDVSASRDWRVRFSAVVREAIAVRWKQSDTKRSWDEFYDANPTLVRPKDFWVDIKVPEDPVLPAVPEPSP